MRIEQDVLNLDAKLVAAAKDVHVLGTLSWPMQLGWSFLEQWERGQPKLPKVQYPPVAMDSTLQSLDRVIRESEAVGTPPADFVAASARSYHTAARMLMRAGSHVAGVLAVELYGRPGAQLPGAKVTSLDAARYFMEVSRQYASDHALDHGAYCVPAQVVADEMTRRINEVITDHPIRIVIDPELGSKAAAGASRIRLRKASCYSEFDIEQLIQHEAFVHSLTALNGRLQPALKSLSLSAPRTVGTQEGLATFAELVTGAIDIARMQRIALRVVAIDAAIGGADFIDVFRIFIDAGQPPVESFNSTMRVFRGVPLTGGAAFTKDAVYLQSLLEVHTFFRWALKEQRYHLCEHLMAGRMTLEDVMTLAPSFSSGELAKPRYLPPWMTRTNGLTAYLSFSVFADEIRLERVKEQAFRQEN